MMKKIETLDQLIAQRALTRMRIRQLEEDIKDDFTEIKNELKPWNLLGGMFHDAVKSEKTGLVNASIGVTIDTLIKNLIFRKSNFITRAIVSFVAKNYARNLVAKNSDTILDWIQMLLMKMKSKHSQNGHHYDKSTAGAEWEY